MEYTFDRNPPSEWRNIYLIGYMGSGKSSTSKHLARILDLPVIELDEVISDYYGASIPEIFEEIGEEGFRALETLILAVGIGGTGPIRYDILKGAVFSCGGGVPLNIVNVAAMQNTGYVVWLNTSPEETLRRLTASIKEKKEAEEFGLGDDTAAIDVDDNDVDDNDVNENERPLLKGKMNIEDITEMMEIREPYYEAAADIKIDTDGKTPEEVAGEIVMALDLVPTVS